MSGIRRSVGSAGGLPGWRGRCSPLRFASRIEVAQWRVSGLGDRGCVRAIAAREPHGHAPARPRLSARVAVRPSATRKAESVAQSAEPHTLKGTYD